MKMYYCQRRESSADDKKSRSLGNSTTILFLLCTACEGVYEDVFFSVFRIIFLTGKLLAGG